MILFRPTIQSDLDYVKDHPHGADYKRYPNLHPIGDCVTGLNDHNKIWGIGGVVKMWPGVGEFWMLLTEDFNDIITSHAALQEVRRFVDDRIKLYELIRAQAVVKCDFVAANKMIEFLGFENETPDGMENYLPDGSDAYMYAKVI